MSYHR